MTFTGLCRVSLGLWTPTLATPIVYKLSGDFTGTVNANLFLNAPFVLTGTADTDTIIEVDVGIYINPIESLSINPPYVRLVVASFFKADDPLERQI